MLCRALLTAVAISYLICVLLLSGLQKEDLDVNTLKKLQRHNVNIDDMNNANLREDCLSKPSTENRNIQQMNNDYVQNKTVETNAFDKMSATLFRKEEVRKKNLDNVMGYLINNINNNKDNTYNNDFTTRSENDVTHPNLDVIKFWNFAKPNSTPQTTIKVDNPNKQRDNYFLPTKDVELISGLLAEYIAKKTDSTTTASPKFKHAEESPQPLNGFMTIEELSPYLRTLLESNNKDKVINFNNSDVKRQYNIYLKEIINKTETNETIRTVGKPFKIYEERDRSRNHSLLMSLGDLIMLSDTIKNFAPALNIKAITEMPEILRSRNNEPESDKQPDVKRSTASDNGSTQSKTNKKDEQDKSLSTNIIKEIARSIKDIIINDLKNEITTEATKTTSMMTTTEFTTETPKPEKVKEATHVIEKIMELFQQFKTVKESTIITANSKLKMTEKKDLEHEYTGPVKIIYQSEPVNQYSLMPVSPLIKQTHNINNMLPITYYNSVKPKSAAITIQTNLNEIPPLGIQISKPMNIINQNIIVTTQPPFTRGNSDWRHHDFNKRDRTSNGEENRYPGERQKYTYTPKYLQGYDNPQGFRGSHREDVRYTSRDRDNSNHRGDYSNYRSWNYKTHSDGSNNRPRNNVKRFHERLETYDRPRMVSREKVYGREECGKLKVASRQQLPLNGAKKVTGYDDTHFNNFLKTQQKVNAMLERILATKTNFDGAHGDDRNIQLT